MRNLTLSLEADLVRWLKVEAAQNDKSVSRFVADLLKDQMRVSRAYAEAMKRSLARPPVALNRKGRYPTRDELHDRTLLR